LPGLWASLTTSRKKLTLSQNIPLDLTWDLIIHLKAFEIPGRESFLILTEYNKKYRRNEFVSFPDDLPPRPIQPESFEAG